jgi:hypothetical protein
MAILTEIAAQVSLGIAGQIEQRVRVVLNDKPIFMPGYMWEKMCRTVISLQYYPVKVTGRAVK